MKEKRKLALLCGLLGCLCYGGGDWLMMYGDPAHAGKLIWLLRTSFNTTDRTFWDKEIREIYDSALFDRLQKDFMRGRDAGFIA